MVYVGVRQLWVFIQVLDLNGGLTCHPLQHSLAPEYKGKHGCSSSKEDPEAGKGHAPEACTGPLRIWDQHKS